MLHIIFALSMYYNLPHFAIKEKIFFMLAAMATMYMVTTIVFTISQIGVDYGNAELNTIAKNLITCTFVPVNGILSMSAFAHYCDKYKNKEWNQSKWKKKVIRLLIIFMIILILEFFYMKSVGLSILEMINSINRQ